MKKEFTYKIVEDHVTILRCFTMGGGVVIPRSIDGYVVTDIAPYAFSAYDSSVEDGALVGNALVEITLPDTIVRIGRYAFYGCENLERISFYSNIKDIGAGAFTGCHRVRKLDVTIVEGVRSCLRELLMELREKQSVTYHCKHGMAKLVFPEFFEEAVENTPARILETHTHGSGMLYRNCFVETVLQFPMYDKRFLWAIENEKMNVVFEIAFGRLCYPLFLLSDGKERYVQYLKNHLKEAAKWALFQEDAALFLHFLSEEVSSTREELEVLLHVCEKERQIEFVSYFMDMMEERYPICKTSYDRFEL